MDSSFLTRRRLEKPWLDHTKVSNGLMCCSKYLNASSATASGEGQISQLNNLLN